jgi:putative proteasome-type protease
MTYCVAVRLDSGVLFCSDSRTNAGVDHIATFSKMKVFERKDDRVLVLLSSGNLSVTQSVFNILEKQKNAEPGEPTIWTVSSLFDAAQLVGEAVREVQRRDGPYLVQGSIESGTSLLLGGQIRGEEQRLFHIYPQGNFIEATYDTIYFQLGESKYGKPVLDRVLTRETSLMDATKCTMVSFDSTMRSNISVGLPIDLLVYETDSLAVGVQRRIDETDRYFQMVHMQWGEGLRRVFAELPNPDWK